MSPGCFSRAEWKENRILDRIHCSGDNSTEPRVFAGPYYRHSLSGPPKASVRCEPVIWNIASGPILDRRRSRAPGLLYRIMSQFRGSFRDARTSSFRSVPREPDAGVPSTNSGYIARTRRPGSRPPRFSSPRSFLRPTLNLPQLCLRMHSKCTQILVNVSSIYFEEFSRFAKRDSLAERGHHF